MDLHGQIKAFHDRNPYQLVIEDKPETGERVYSVRIVECVPDALSGVIGDVLHNLRAALDQLAWQLVLVNNKQPRRRTGFPIGRDRQEFETDAHGKVQGISKAAIRLIHRLKPYRGGREPFWVIHELDRVDKHQSIVPVGAANTIVHMPFKFRPWDDVPEFRFDLGIKPADTGYPLKDGTVLFRSTADSRKLHDEPKFTFSVSFGDGQILDGQPVVPTLHQLIEFVERVVDILDGKFFSHTKIPKRRSP
jgi:hypothetical protein